MIKIHPIQTGSVRVKQFQLTGAKNTLSRLWQLFFTQKWAERMPIYCWLVEHPSGLILIDTGETARVNEKGYLPDSAAYRGSLQVDIKREDEVDRQLAALGFSPDDISAIYLTHLHTDHVGGLYHFPNTPIFAPKNEYEIAISPKGEGNGFLKKNWPEWFKPQLIDLSDGAEGNFASSQKMTDDGSIVAIPTPGHSAGHLAYVIKDEDIRYVIAGDVTFNLETLATSTPNVILSNNDAVESVAALKTYALAAPTVVLSSHDDNVSALLANKTAFTA